MINLISRKDEKPAQSLLKKRDKDGFVAPIWKLGLSAADNSSLTNFRPTRTYSVGPSFKN
jgi:hypothetical protein